MDRFKLPSEIPDDQWPAPSVFIEEAQNLVTDAREQNLEIRIMGGLAIYLHCIEHEVLWEKLGRLGKKVFTDIDLVSYQKYRVKLIKFFQNRGYVLNQKLLYHYGKSRQIYYGETIPMVEIFFDRLAMNHKIHYKKRLEADPLTVPLAELLLQKLQMVRMHEKDIKDSIVLLRAHEFGEDDEDRINRSVLGTCLGSDWGFYYTATENLKKIRDSLTEYSVLSNGDNKVIERRIAELMAHLEAEPKTFKWKSRALLGTKKKWYNEVDEWDVIDSPS
jgi:hypothetical protein